MAKKLPTKSCGNGSVIRGKTPNFTENSCFKVNFRSIFHFFYQKN
jgi:hypothetical protein